MNGYGAFSDSFGLPTSFVVAAGIVCVSLALIAFGTADTAGRSILSRDVHPIQASRSSGWRLFAIDCPGDRNVSQRAASIGWAVRDHNGGIRVGQGITAHSRRFAMAGKRAHTV